MQITAQMVKDLREKTGAGMMKCKEALAECNGNLEEAIDFLRKKGLASADKRSGRATSQGLVIPLTTADRRTAAIVEVNCETDFVARNDDFGTFANKIAELVLNNPSVKTVEDLNKLSIEGQSVEEFVKTMIAKTGENISVSRAEHIEFAKGKYGIFDSYIHGEGSIGVLVQLSTATEEAAKNAEVTHYAHEIALQAAAMKPSYTFRSEVPTETLQREKEVILGQISNDPKNAGKPENILAKIVEGRIDKYCKENCLVEQMYVKDDSKSITDMTNDLSKKIGAKAEVVTFRRWARGEAAAAEAS
ncbi:MAG: translation elongation factor Ts, partial [Candidatus Riflebacteria bacterium]|nr:translation elongation factor Ts [Candidatus Riflebacteria bacterium]